MEFFEEVTRLLKVLFNVILKGVLLLCWLRQPQKRREHMEFRHRKIGTSKQTYISYIIAIFSYVISRPLGCVVSWFFLQVFSRLRITSQGLVTKVASGLHKGF